MGTKQIAVRLDANLLDRIDNLTEIINRDSDFPARSRTDVIAMLLKKQLDIIEVPTPPCPSFLKKHGLGGH